MDQLTHHFFLVNMIVSPEYEVNFVNVLRQPDVIWRPHVRQSNDVFATLVSQLPRQHLSSLDVVGVRHLFRVDRGQGVQPFALNKTNLEIIKKKSLTHLIIDA